MSTPDARSIVAESEAAYDHRSQWEAIAVTFECSHLTLMPKVRTVMGVGATGGCRVCWENSMPEFVSGCDICINYRTNNTTFAVRPNTDRMYRLHHEVDHYGGSVPRMVCKLEPTGHLHDDFLKRKSDDSTTPKET